MLINNSTATPVVNISGANKVPQMRKRRKLTPRELEDANRLRSIWLGKKASNRKYTQAYVAEQCGWESQSTFSQYLGKIPLNFDALIKLSRVLECAPSEISPSMAKLLPAADMSPGAVELAEIYESATPAEKALMLGNAKLVRGSDLDSSGSGQGSPRDKRSSG